MGQIQVEAGKFDIICAGWGEATRILSEGDKKGGMGITGRTKLRALPIDEVIFFAKNFNDSAIRSISVLGGNVNDKEGVADISSQILRGG